MKAPALKANQAKLKEQYRDHPESAVQQLRSVGKIDTENLACELIEPGFLSPAGLHPSSGGDGTFACSVELMLSGLVSCAAVTMAAVANSMRIEIRDGTVIGTGTMDFRGTLAVDREAPVGLTDIQIKFDLDTDADPPTIEKLISLTERYCVVYQTLAAPPKITVVQG